MRELERNDTSSAGQSTAHPPIAVIGPGRVGGSIARAAAAAGVAVAVGGRDGIAEACADAELALLCVPDGEIEPAAARLAAAAPHLAFAGHCSGATTLDALTPAVAAGAEAFSLHPLQTIPDPETPLDGAPAAVAGSSATAVAAARELAEALRMRPFEVPERARAAYHAAASISSNFLVALEQSAVELLESAGIEDGRELLAPLVLRTAVNWSERGGDALTGPIARGDEATVERHLAALAETAPELLPIYRVLAERARAVAGAERRD